MRFTQKFLGQIVAGMSVLLALTVIVGIGYPATVWAVSRIGSNSAEGSPLRDTNGCVVGSRLIGVDPQVEEGAADPFFHNRVTGSISDEDAFAVSDPAASLPTNQGPSSEALAAFIEERRAVIAARDGVDPAAVPVDAITGSGSGIDPDISPAYAAIQIQRVAQFNDMSVDAVTALVAEHTDGRQLGFLGNETVNVPELNLALGLTAPQCGTS